MCGDEDLFKTMTVSSNLKLNLACQTSADVKGKGTVHLSVSGDKGDRLIEFKDTLYVPDFRTNFVSVAKITRTRSYFS